jgi:hypothetical protein
MAEVLMTPTVEAYARLKQHEREQVARALALNRKILAEQIETAEDALLAVKQSKAQEVSRAKSEARQAARAEVAKIYEDEFTRERVRAFEAYPLVPVVYGDLEACSQESYEWDLKHSKRRKRVNA